jgi:hypothetical protein
MVEMSQIARAIRNDALHVCKDTRRIVPPAKNESQRSNHIFISIAISIQMSAFHRCMRTLRIQRCERLLRTNTKTSMDVLEFAGQRDQICLSMTTISKGLTLKFFM